MSFEYYTVGKKKYNTLSEIKRDIKEGRLRKNCRVHKTILLPKMRGKNGK